MGTHASVIVSEGSENLLGFAFAELARLEARWSRFLPESDISRLNLALGAPVDVDPDTVGLLEAVRDAAVDTAGAFDPTLLPALVSAGYAASRVDPANVTVLPPGARAGSDLSGIRIEGTEVRLPVDLSIDPGGIGKGYAADLIVARLLARGARGALVEIGGDLVVGGEPPASGAWSIGVEDPEDPGSLIDRVRLVEGAIATSSTRKRRWRVEGEERQHILDPRTGLSAVGVVASATVIAASGARAEALATAGVLDPPDATLEALPERGGAALLVLTDGTRRETSNWGDYR